MSKYFLVLCASALLLQSICGQCIGYGSNVFGYGGNLANGCGCGIGAPVYSPVASASGGGLAVSSASPFAPNGISVISENAIEGIVDVAGQLPLLAAVAFEGNLPTAGAAGTSYSCGNGNVGITGESQAAAGVGYGSPNAGLINANFANAGLVNANFANSGLINANLVNAGQINANLINAGLIGYNGLPASSCGYSIY